VRALIIAALFALGAGSATSAIAGPLPSLDRVLHLDLRLRYYRFDKLYDAPGQSDQRSAAVGGMFDVTTAPFAGGFGLGVGLYGAWATESYAPDDRRLETTLMGPGPRLRSVGEAFAQFQRGGVLLRVGRQLIETPWLSSDDSRMLPQSYSGVRVQYTLVGGLQLIALDLQRYKSRSSSGFTRDNVYYPQGYEGDPLADAVRVFPRSVQPPEAPGTAAAAAVYAGRTVHAQLWYYDFRDFARTSYVDGGYTFAPIGDSWRPHLEAQLMRQSGGGDLVRYGAEQFGVGGPVDSALWGMRAGLERDALDLSLSYDELQHRDGFGGGAIISPYTDRAAMYASEMAIHLLKYGPGHVFELAARLSFPGKPVQLKVGLLAFHTRYSGNSNALYFDGTYSLRRWVTGLQLRDRLIWTNGARINGGQAFVYNRVMFEYHLRS
jgi:hypothetical protein